MKATLRMRLSFEVAFACAVVMLATACNLFQSDLDLAVSVSVDPASFAVGDTTEIRVVVSNTSGDERTVTGSACLIGFQVFDSAGSFVAPHWVCAMILVEQRIPPGGSIQEHWTWTGWTGLEDPAWLSPGTYKVVGVLDANEAVVRSPERAIELLSPS